MDSLQRHSGLDGGDYAVTASAVARPIASPPAFDFDVVRSVKLHPRIAAFVALAVFAVVVLYAVTRKPMYHAESLTYIEPLTTKVVSDGSGGIYDPARYDSYIQQQIQTAGRQDILEDAISKLPEGSWRLPNESLADAADRLAGALKVARVGSSYQLSISFSGTDPDNTAAIVNAVTKSYLEKGRKDENAQSDGRLQLLHEESDRIQAELTQDRTEQAALSKTLGVADAEGTTSNPYDAQLMGIRSELVSAREAHEVAEAQLASVSRTSPANEPAMKAVADDAIAGDAGLVALKSTINQRRATLSSQMSGLTPSNPLYKQDQDELASLDRELDLKTNQLRQAAEQRVEEKLRLDLRRTGDVEARLNAELAREVSTANGAAPKLQRASELAADITRLEARYATVDDALRGLAIESNGPGTAHLSVPAAVPTAPEASRRSLLLAMSLPLALIAGAVAAIIARKRDQKVYSGRDVEDELGVAPLCTIPAVHEVSDRVMGEYMLRLAAGIERGYRLNGARSFVLTAVSEATEVEIFAHEVHEQLEKLGFNAVVAHASTILFGGEDRCPEGKSPRYRRNEGAAGSRLEALKKSYDLILIPAEPLLHSAGTEYAASAADTTFVVVESGVTTRVELQQAVILLRKLKVRGVGTVITNQSSRFEKLKRPMSIEVLEQRLEQPVQMRSVSTPRAPRQVVQVPDGSVQQQESEKQQMAEQKDSLPVQMRFEPVAVAPERTEARRNPEAIKSFNEPTAPVPTPVTAVVFMEQPVPPPANGLTEVVPQKDPIVVTEPARVDTEAERLKREVIARVKAKFTPPASLQVAAEPVIPFVDPGVDVPAVEEKMESASEEAVDQPAKMLLWGASIKKPEAEEIKAQSAEAGLAASTPNHVTSNLVADKKTVSEAIAQALMNSEALASVRPPQPARPVRNATPGRQLAERATLKKQPVGAEAVTTRLRESAQSTEAKTAETSPQSLPAMASGRKPERRKRPRVATFPQGLSKAVSSMGTRAEHRVSAFSAGPRLTAAEEAIVHMSESRRERISARITEPQSTRVSRRWGLLSKFDEPLDGSVERPEQDRAAV